MWNKKIGSYFLIIAGIVTLLPFIFISFYNNPIAGDDFFLANMSKKLGFVDAQKFWYTSWTGRYFSMALFSVSPLVFGNFFLYKLVPIVLLLGMIGAVYLVVNAVFPKMESIDKAAIVSLYIFLYLFQLPSTAEGLYWFICSVTYLLPSVLTILVLYMLIRISQTNRTRYLIGAALLCFAIVGCSETSMLVLFYLLSAITVLYYFAQKKWNSKFIILLAITAVFSIVVVTAPGNTVREGLLPNNHNFSYSLIRTLGVTATYLPTWLPVFLLSAVLLHDIFDQNTGNTYMDAVFNVHPLVSFLLMLSLPLLCIFPVIWSVGSENAYLRIVSTAYFFTLLGFVYFVFTLSRYLHKKTAASTFVSPIAATLVMLVILVQVYLPHNAYHPNNIRRAYMDLLNGTAENYNTQVSQRFTAIANAQADTCEVPLFENVSSVLYPTEYPLDITSTPKDWRNESLATFFGKKAVIVSAGFEEK